MFTAPLPRPRTHKLVIQAAMASFGRDKKLKFSEVPKILSLKKRIFSIVLRNPALAKPHVRLAMRKKTANALDTRLRRKGRAGYPARIKANLTRRCNLSCMMCCAQRPRSTAFPHDIPWCRPEDEMPLDGWISLLDQTVKFRPVISMTGGEPMLYREFDGLIEAAGQRNLPVQINTNGTLLAEHADAIVQHGVFSISVSIDGPEDVHDRIRGREGLFRSTLKGVEALMDARRRLGRPAPIIQLACTVTKNNIHALQDMLPLAGEIKPDIVIFQHTVFNTPDNVEKHNRLLSDIGRDLKDLDIIHPSIPEGEFYESDIELSDIPLLMEFIQKTKKWRGTGVKFLQTPDVGINELKSYYMDIDYPKSPVCHGLWTTMRVMPDGTVSPCLHFVAGHVARQPIEDIWNGPAMRSIRTLIAKQTLPGCARCCELSF